MEAFICESHNPSRSPLLLFAAISSCTIAANSAATIIKKYHKGRRSWRDAKQRANAERYKFARTRLPDQYQRRQRRLVAQTSMRHLIFTNVVSPKPSKAPQGRDRNDDIKESHV